MPLQEVLGLYLVIIEKANFSCFVHNTNQSMNQPCVSATRVLTH